MDNKKREQLKMVAKGKGKVSSNAGKLKVSDIFLPDDVGSIKEYLLVEVIVPKIKDSILSVVETLLYGHSVGVRKRRPYGMKVSYRDYYDDDRFAYSGRSNRPANPYRSNFGRFHNTDVSYETEEDALDALEYLRDIESRGHVIRVQDVYDYIGESAPWTSNDWGWYRLGRVDAIEVEIDDELRWILTLPKAIPVEK
jgi:hypothetical protein